MPALQLTKALYYEPKVNSKLIDELRGLQDSDRISTGLLQLLTAENAKEQIEKLKGVVKEIQRLIQGNNKTDDKELLFLKYLVHLFFISTTKNPTRRVIISSFQGFPEIVQSSVIGPAIEKSLRQLFEAPIKKAVTNQSVSLEECLDQRHNVETITALIENFQLGERCVSNLCLETLSYLSTLQKLFFDMYGPHLSPVQQNEVMHHCLETVKLANRVCQRSSVTMETRLQEAVTRQEYTETAAIFIQTDMKILQKEEFLLDCKTTSGMNICLLLKYTSVGNHMLPFLAKIVFQHIDWFCQACDNIPLPGWLTRINIDQLGSSRLSSSSYLCLCYSILTMVSMELLLQLVDNRCILLDVLLPEFLCLTKRCTDVGSKLLAAKSVCVVTQRVRTYVQKDGASSCDPGVVKRFHGDSLDTQTILDYVWTSWEDSVDAIRFTVKDLFENVVAIHTSVSATGSCNEDTFLLRLTESILADVSWSCKGKYGTLAVLVSHIGSTRILTMHDGIAAEILEQLKEHTLSCYASDMYESLFKTHHTQLEVCDSRGSLWYRTWIDPVLTVLCGSHKLQKKHILEYILPKLLKTGQGTLSYMITTLTSQIDMPASSRCDSHGITHTENQLGALVMCLRRARVMGQLRPTTDSQGKGSEVKDKLVQDHIVTVMPVHGDPTVSTDTQSSKLWCGVVNVNLLQQALICKDEQIRLDAFALLCENQKTSETISNTELELVQTFVPQNLNSLNPAFRQVFLSHLKKFLSRMKESSIALKRQVHKNEGASITLQVYKTFLVQLTRSLFRSLYPGCVFAKRTTCLGALSVLLNTYDLERKLADYDFSFHSVVRPCDITSLLECLTDTYEDNKREAADILISHSQTKENIGTMDERMTRDMTGLAFRLSQSTRPQDCLTAAYLFKVLLYQPSISQVLTEFCRGTGYCSSTSNTETLDDPNAHDYDLRKDQILSEQLQGDGHEPKILEYLENIKDDDLTRKFRLLWILLNNLQDEVTVAKCDLIVAAANRPMYPTMLCVRYALAQIDFRKIPEESRHVWQIFFVRFINLCLEISAVVSPVVQNSSPEGNVPLDEIPGHGIIENPNDESLTRSHNTVMLMPEYLIVCCWRSTKEISLVFGQLTSDLPIASSGHSHGLTNNSGLLSLSQVLEIGDYFTGQLLESVHRGAFELAYAGFVKLTDMLWRSSLPDLHQLPKKWLHEVLLDIKSGSAESRLCATRRSAGVPFYVQALVSTEPVSTGRTSFKETMQDLLHLAYDGSVVTADSCSAKVHALNILRALYKDSRLKDDVAPYVADGLKVAILGFKSALWAVRNSATLLMTAMMTRIFGVKRSRDETSFSKKNCQTGKTFFFKYPSLYQFLLEELKEATLDLNNQLHPGLFPILMVLGRLFPSTMEGTDTSLNIAAFIPLVIRCSSSPVLKTRVMAARALQPLVEKDHVTKVFSDLLSLLPSKAAQVIKQNQTHGVLLQIKEMLGTVQQLPQTIQTSLANLVCDMWSERVHSLISRTNPCLLTRREALQVTADILDLFGPCVAIQQSLETVIELEVTQESQVSALYQYSPGLSEFRSTICNLYLAFMVNLTGDRNGSHGIVSRDCENLEETILTFLRSDSYEVRRSVLSMLTHVVRAHKHELTSEIHRESETGKDSTVVAINGDLVPENRGCNSTLKNSYKVYAHLLYMADNETHEDCQVHLFRLLESHQLTLAPDAESRSAKDIEQHVSRLCQSIARLCQRIENQTMSDPVVAAMIGYAGSLLLALCNIISDRQAGNHLIGQNTSAVSQLLGMVQSYSGSDCSTEIHMACVHVLQKNCTHILLTGEHTVLGSHDNKRAVFKGILSLLQVDDAEVRDEAADIYCVMSQDKLNMRAHPYVSVRLFLEDWVETQGDRNLAVACLLQLVEGQENKQEVVEERLFDRGEMNAYRDNVDVIQIADAVLMKYLSGEGKPICQAGVLDISAGSTESDTLQQQVQSAVIDDPNIRQTLGKYLDLYLSTRNDNSLEIPYAFENGADYQTHMLSLFRLSLFIKYGALFLSDKSFVQKCVRTVAGLQHIDRLPTLLKETLDYTQAVMNINL